jgi:hypothetical protein
MKYASQNQVSRQGPGAGKNPRRNQSEVHNSGKSRVAKAAAERGRAWVETYPGCDSETGDGQLAALQSRAWNSTPENFQLLRGGRDVAAHNAFWARVLVDTVAHNEFRNGTLVGVRFKYRLSLPDQSGIIKKMKNENQD